MEDIQRPKPCPPWSVCREKRDKANSGTAYRAPTCLRYEGFCGWLGHELYKTLDNSSKKTNIGAPPEGAAGARALGGGRIGERSEPKSTTPCDRSEGGRGDAGLGMRENSECNRCFSRMRKTAYRQAIRVISSKQRASIVAPKRVISGSPRGADGSEEAWLVGAHGERCEPKSDRPPSHRAGGRGQHGAGLRFLRWRRSESAPRYMLNGKQEI